MLPAAAIKMKWNLNNVVAQYDYYTLLIEKNKRCWAFIWALRLLTCGFSVCSKLLTVENVTVSVLNGTVAWILSPLSLGKAWCYGCLDWGGVKRDKSNSRGAMKKIYTQLSSGRGLENLRQELRTCVLTPVKWMPIFMLVVCPRGTARWALVSKRRSHVKGSETE